MLLGAINDFRLCRGLEISWFVRYSSSKVGKVQKGLFWVPTRRISCLKKDSLTHANNQILCLIWDYINGKILKVHGCIIGEL